MKFHIKRSFAEASKSNKKCTGIYMYFPANFYFIIIHIFTKQLTSTLIKLQKLYNLI